MPATPLNVETFEEMRPVQDISSFEISSKEMLDMLSMYDPYGMWRLDLETGHVFWSDDVFHIHGLEVKTGPVNLNDAINAYHPDDARVVGQLMEECIQNKSGYRFVLRLKRSDGSFKLVKSVAKYRENAEGKPEVIGLFSQFAPPMRSIAAIE